MINHTLFSKWELSLSSAFKLKSTPTHWLKSPAPTIGLARVSSKSILLESSIHDKNRCSKQCLKIDDSIQGIGRTGSPWQNNPVFFVSSYIKKEFQTGEESKCKHKTIYMFEKIWANVFLNRVGNAFLSINKIQKQQKIDRLDYLKQKQGLGKNFLFFFSNH